jgi:hypothetical protein
MALKLYNALRLKTPVTEQISALQSYKQIFIILFPIMFAENAVNYDTSRMVYGHC